MPRTAPTRGRHISYNADGEMCMAVVDPATRKLLIPMQYIFLTRAQHRGTLPSLCQLFLASQCRKGQLCYQVHADWGVVQHLRSEVVSLPLCCHVHGDKDHMGILENAPLGTPISFDQLHTQKDEDGHQQSTDAAAAAEAMVHANDIVLYVPGCSLFEGGYVPLGRVSYTNGLRRMLDEQRSLFSLDTAQVTLLNPTTGFAERKVVVDASGATVCRLHAMGRCRYAEECKFLHLCKHITEANPQLTASPSTMGVNGSTECAAPGSDGSNAASAGSTRCTETPVTSCKSCAKNSQDHTGAGAFVGHSVFANNFQLGQKPVPLRNGGTETAEPAGAVPKGNVGPASSLQQSHSMSYHHDPSMMADAGNSGPHESTKSYLAGGGGAADNGPLLGPRRGCVGGGVGRTDYPFAAPHLSKCPSARLVSPIGTPSVLPQRPLHMDSPIVPSMMGVSTNSFSSCMQNNNSAQSAASHPCSKKGSHCCVSINLPAVDSPLALKFEGTSICSEKTISSPEERSFGLSISQNSGFSRSMTQMETSRNPTRWQHHPYSAFCTKTYT